MTEVESSTKNAVKKESYFKWLAHQLKGWPKQSYYLFWFALGLQVMTLLNNPITPVTVITFIGTILGVLCILSIGAVKSVNGWLGIISAICFIYAGWTAKNYLSIFEQVAYILTLDLPVLLSVKTWNDDTVNHLRKFGKKEWVIAILATLAVYSVSGWAIGAFTPDPRPWIDALSFSVSLTAGVMCFMRYNNQYFWWLFSGVFQLILWGITFKQGDATLAMAANSSIYVINDLLVFRYSPWFKNSKFSKNLEAHLDA